jgi:MFS family permease
MVAGLAVYLAGTVVAMLAQNILTVYRGGIAQGLGSACSVAVGRAMLPLCVRHRPGAGHGVGWLRCGADVRRSDVHFQHELCCW